ncbi:MAG: hypothetical protein BGO50_01480 [Rhodanobacter sp. 67-28]|nr:MAG: hypothetical protein BGO50_01480 [Rhodanobacter sp. 67-28]
MIPNHQNPHQIPGAARERSLAPSIGDLFEYRGGSYRCNAWLCPAEQPKPDPSWSAAIDALLFETAFQREGVRFRYCLREEATHVAGSGVCGCIAEIGRIQVTGRVDWSETVLRDAEAAAVALGRSRRIVG